MNTRRFYFLFLLNTLGVIATSNALIAQEPAIIRVPVMLEYQHCLIATCPGGSQHEWVKGCDADPQVAKDCAYSEAANLLQCPSIEVVHEGCDEFWGDIPCRNCSTFSFNRASAPQPVWNVKMFACLCNGKPVSVNGQGSSYCEAYLMAKKKTDYLAEKVYHSPIRCRRSWVVSRPTIPCCH